MSTPTMIPVEEYLETSYRPDCDYLEGELLKRNVGEWDHSRLQSLVVHFLMDRESEWGILAVTEQRVQVKTKRYRVPDITVFVGGPPSGPILYAPPFLCIEILSAGDHMARCRNASTIT